MDNMNFSSLASCHKVLDQTTPLQKHRLALQDTTTNQIFFCEFAFSDISKAIWLSLSYKQS